MFHADFSLKFVDAEMIEVELAQNVNKCSTTYLLHGGGYVAIDASREAAGEGTFLLFTPHASKVSVIHTSRCNVHFRLKLLDMYACSWTITFT